MIVEKDVVLAMLGASAALAGFVLVFLGIIVSSYQSWSGAVPEQVVRPYRTLGGILLAAFGLCLLSVFVSFIWLVAGGPNEVYGLTVGLFIAALVAVFAAAAWATRMAMGR